MSKQESGCCEPLSEEPQAERTRAVAAAATPSTVREIMAAESSDDVVLCLNSRGSEPVLFRGLYADARGPVVSSSDAASELGRRRGVEAEGADQSCNWKGMDT